MNALALLGAAALGAIIMFVTLWTLDLVGWEIYDDDDHDDPHHPVKA